MNEFSDKKIIDSWRKNSAPWSVAVRDNQIESRALITNQAIVDSVLSVAPRTVLDIGCGEGWLARELCLRNIKVLGLDVVSETRSAILFRRVSGDVIRTNCPGKVKWEV